MARCLPKNPTPQAFFTILHASIVTSPIDPEAMSFESMSNVASDILGLAHDEPMGVAQVTSRAVVIFISALVMVRIAEKRFFAKKNAFDVVMALILASMLSRAINGKEPLFATIIAGFALVLLHRILSVFADRSSKIEGLLKGHRNAVVKDGKLIHTTMKHHHVTEDDITEQLRLHGVSDLSHVKAAYLERSGEISVIKSEP